MRKTLRTVSIFALAILLSGAAFAHNNDIKAKWDEFCKTLDKDPGIQPETKSAWKAFGEALMNDRAGAEAPDGELGTKVEEWFSSKKRIEAADKLFGTKDKRGLLERLTLYGDFRYRFEACVKPDTLNDPPNRREHDERVRQRVRFRLGFEYNIEEDLLDFGARITTGPHCNPKDANATFDSNFAKLDANWDRIYLRYTPFSPSRPYRLLDKADFTTEFYLGKFDHRWLFLAGPALWHSDVQPTGFGGLFKFTNFGCNFIDEVRTSLAFYQLTEEQYNEDATIFVAQVGASKGFEWQGHNFKVTVASAIYDVNDPDNDFDGSSIISHGGCLDNGTVGTGLSQRYISEFQLLHNYLQLDFDGFEILGKQRPIQFIFEHTHNASAHNDPTYTWHSSRDANDGYSLIVTMGELKKKGDWRVGYGYFNYERDALFSIVSFSDFQRQTDLIGNKVWLDYNIFDKTSLRVWYAWGQDRIDDGTLTSPEDDHVQGKLRIELLVKF